MNISRPKIGITMGDPASVGPEIAINALLEKDIYELCDPIIVGDIKVLENSGLIYKMKEGIELRYFLNKKKYYDLIQGNK